jgi:hypothetical protein
MAVASRPALLIAGRLIVRAGPKRKQAWFESADQLGPVVYGHVSHRRPVELKQQRASEVSGIVRVVQARTHAREQV